MAKATSKAAAAAAAATTDSNSDSPKTSNNTKWNEEAHQALIGTLLDVMDSADIKWRAHLDFMVQNLAERGQQFSREGIRYVEIFTRLHSAHCTISPPPNTSKKIRLLPSTQRRSHLRIYTTKSINHEATFQIANYEQFSMPSVWDDARQRDLLEEIYFVMSSHQSLSQDDKDAVVAGMQQRGYTTLKWNAIRQHLQKLKRKEGSPTKKAATPSKKRGKALAEADDDDNESPKKKRKGKAAPAPSGEDEDNKEANGLVKDEEDSQEEA